MGELFLPAVLAIEVLAESIEALTEEGGKFVYPADDVFERLGMQTVQPMPPVTTHLDELGLLEHPEMCEIAANVIRNGSASALAERSPSFSVTRIARRAGCAMALNTSFSCVGRMGAPLRIVSAKLGKSLHPIGRRLTIELGLERSRKACSPARSRPPFAGMRR